MVVARGEIQPSRIARVFRAEHALGIARLLHGAGGGDVARVFFRLGKVDGDFQLARRGRREKARVFGDGVYANVIARAAHFIKPFRGSARPFRLVQRAKLGAHHLGRRRNRARQAVGEQFPVG